MRFFPFARSVFFVLTATAALASSGCPELNRQPDRSSPSLFSVDDPAWRNTRSNALAERSAHQPDGVVGATQWMLQEEGGLPDQSRRAH
jgi:hypothetical protein